MDIGGAGINETFAEFESFWIGNEVEGEQYLPAEAAFFRDIVAGVGQRGDAGEGDAQHHDQAPRGVPGVAEERGLPQRLQGVEVGDDLGPQPLDGERARSRPGFTGGLNGSDAVLQP